jgi:glycosyltransferase involved in cell wall biosynthesis
VAAGEIGGAERMLVDLARPRPDSARPHSVALLTPSDALRELLLSEGLDVDDRGPVKEGPLPYLASTLGRGDVRWLREVLVRRGAKIVHLHTFASQVLGTRAAAEARAHVVRTEHSTRVYDDPSCWPFARWSLRRADVVVCISEHVKRTALARATFLDRHRVAVIYNGVDAARFVPRSEPTLALPASRRVRFLALGRLDPRKGLDLALAALSQVQDAELVIVGDGEARPSLERLATDLGVAERVLFAGYTTDVRSAIAGCDVALSSARDEGLGIALLEAMAMGRPVVAVPVGGLPEVVANGQTGWLATRREPEALASVMREAVHDPAQRAKRGRQGRERVLAMFSIEGMRLGYERLYASVSTRVGT